MVIIKEKYLSKIRPFYDIRELDDVENLKKQNTEIVQRICKPPVDPIAAYFDNKNS